MNCKLAVVVYHKPRAAPAQRRQVELGKGLQGVFGPWEGLGRGLESWTCRYLVVVVSPRAVYLSAQAQPRPPNKCFPNQTKQAEWLWNKGAKKLWGFFCLSWGGNWYMLQRRVALWPYGLPQAGAQGPHRATKGNYNVGAPRGTLDILGHALVMVETLVKL